MDGLFKGGLGLMHGPLAELATLCVFVKLGDPFWLIVLWSGRFFEYEERMTISVLNGLL